MSVVQDEETLVDPDDISQEEAADNLEEFLAGRTTLLFTTIAAAAGIDCPFLRTAFIVGFPGGTVVTTQMAGRPGRDGGEGVTDVIFTLKDLERLENDAEGMLTGGVRDTDYASLVAMVRTSGCRQGPLGKYLDGVETTCTQLGSKLCDNCRLAFDVDPPLHLTSDSRTHLTPSPFAGITIHQHRLSKATTLRQDAYTARQALKGRRGAPT